MFSTNNKEKHKAQNSRSKQVLHPSPWCRFTQSFGEVIIDQEDREVEGEEAVGEREEVLEELSNMMEREGEGWHDLT